MTRIHFTTPIRMGQRVFRYDRATRSWFCLEWRANDMIYWSCVWRYEVAENFDTQVSSM